MNVVVVEKGLIGPLPRSSGVDPAPYARSIDISQDQHIRALHAEHFAPILLNLGFLVGNISLQVDVVT